MKLLNLLGKRKKQLDESVRLVVESCESPYHASRFGMKVSRPDQPGAERVR